MQGIPASKSPLAGLFFFSASEGPRALRADGAPCRKALGPGMRRAGAGEGLGRVPAMCPLSFPCRLVDHARAMAPGGWLPGALALGTEAGLLQDRPLGLACLLSGAVALTKVATQVHWDCPL